MPDEIGDLVSGDGPVMSDARDAAQSIVGIVARGIHLADDRVLGAGHARQRRHRRADTVAAMLSAYRFQRTWRVR